MTRKPFSPRSLATLSGAVVLAGIAAGHASAHAYLVRTVPVSGTSLHGAPQAITLEFDESVSSRLSRVSLVGAKTGSISGLHVQQSGGSGLSVELPRLPRDLYRVAWHTVSEDDLHATGGTLVFGVDTAVPASPGNASKTTPGAPPEEVLLRWEDFAGIAVLIGALATLLYVLPAAARRGARRVEVARGPLTWLGLGGCFAALVSGVGLLFIQAGQAGGMTGIGRVLTGTAYGHAWIARETILILIALALLAFRRSPSSRRVRLAAATLGTGLVVPLALISHAASVKGAASVATAALAVHILAASLWVGGVVALCLAIVEFARAGERSSARALALSFGELAIVSVALIAITGIAVLGIHVRSLDALVTTGYGKTLIVKTGLFLLAGAVGLTTTAGLRWKRAPGRLNAAWVSAPRFEAAVLVAVLVPAALLTASAPAREAVAPAQRPSPATTAAESSASAADLVLSVAVEPNRPGENFVTVSVYNTRRPDPAPIQAVHLSLTGKARASRSVDLDPIGTNQWQTVTTLEPGKVRIGVAVQRPHLPDATTATAVSVRAGPSPAEGQPTQSPAPVSTFMQRPLAPILEPVALSGAALLVLVMLGRVVRRRIARPLPRHIGQSPVGELQPRRGGR